MLLLLLLFLLDVQLVASVLDHGREHLQQFFSHVQGRGGTDDTHEDKQPPVKYRICTYHPKTGAVCTPQSRR